MDLYYSHIVDILKNNVGIGRDELFIKSGMDSKREFITEINRLSSEYRITYRNDRLKYSPRVLELYGFEKRYNILAERFQLNYLPTEYLKKELEYFQKGTEPEDCLEYELEITGYNIIEKYKPFLEKHNNIALDFTRFKYYLWARYLYPECQIKSKADEGIVNIVYVGFDPIFVEQFIKSVKEKFIQNSNWYGFRNIIDSVKFLESRFISRQGIHLIITENNKEFNGVEFTEAVRELESEFEKMYMKFNIPIMVLINESGEDEIIEQSSNERIVTFNFCKSEDFYLLGNVVRSLCELW